MKAPITYQSNFIVNPEIALTRLQNELDWQQRDQTPRQEYYWNHFGVPYTYGTGRGQREYLAQPDHEIISEIRKQLEELTKTKFEVCFLNRYPNQSNHLGWHADDSPEMDDARPIAIVSLGVGREIWFRSILGTQCSSCGEKKYHKMDCNVRTSRKTIYGEIEKLQLENGSLCLMQAGMQDVWQHRIPKASFHCGERISLTYRGYVKD